MLLAHALKVVHLGRSWQWRLGSDDPSYRQMLKMFQDKRTSLFSLQQIGKFLSTDGLFRLLILTAFIAQMGVNEGKALCQWFGPNTIAQCLKKLAIYDDWSQLTVHVAMDNLLIASDVRQLAATPWSDCVSSFFNYFLFILLFRQNQKTKKGNELMTQVRTSHGDLF